MSDSLIRLLGDLPMAAPDAARTERTRMRCRARLTQQAERARGSRRSAWSRHGATVWQLLIAGLGVAYLTAVIVQALSVYAPA